MHNFFLLKSCLPDLKLRWSASFVSVPNYPPGIVFKARTFLLPQDAIQAQLVIQKMSELSTTDSSMTDDMNLSSINEDPNLSSITENPSHFSSSQVRKFDTFLWK
jgi:hypothetical protein